MSKNNKKEGPGKSPIRSWDISNLDDCHTSINKPTKKEINRKDNTYFENKGRIGKKRTDLE